MKAIYKIILFSAIAFMGSTATPVHASKTEAPKTETKADVKKSETAVFYIVPRMTCQKCENRIKSNMRFEKGIQSIETSLENQTVTIKYNPRKTNVEAFVKAFKKLGYTASTEGRPEADPNAAPVCKE